MFKIFIFSLLCIKFLVPEKIKIVDHKSWHKAPSTLHTNYILLRGDSPIQWGRCHRKCLEPWMSSQIVPACLGHLWSMILKTNSNPEMDLYLYTSLAYILPACQTGQRFMTQEFFASLLLFPTWDCIFIFTFHLWPLSLTQWSMYNNESWYHTCLVLQLHTICKKTKWRYKNRMA